MRHASLFTGVGGFDLAAAWHGFENVFQVEKDKRCLKNLEKNFPTTKRYEDVKTFSPIKEQFNNTIDILTGGDPCQPHSHAGLRKGKTDDRYLWPEMFRIAYELNVPWVVNENVSGSISNGILDLKADDLESIGYTCQAYSIPAEAVGALHQRERIWLIAYNAHSHRDCSITRELCEQKEIKKMETERHQIHNAWQPVDLWSFGSYSDSERFSKFDNSSKSRNSTEGISRYFGFGPNAHGDITGDFIKSCIVGMLNGLPEGMDYVERNARIKGAGNAIVPQIAYELFKAIKSL